MRKKNRVVPALLLTTFGLAVAVVGPACDSSPDDASPPAPTGIEAFDNRDAFQERDFVREPSLRARLSSSVMLDLEGVGTDDEDGEDTGGKGTDVVRYAVPDSETVSVCLEGEEGVASVSLKDSQGREVVRATRESGCVTADLEPGDYETSVVRAPGDPTPKLVFLHAAAPPAPQCAPDEAKPDYAGHPSNAWWLIGDWGPIEATPSNGNPFTGPMMGSSALFDLNRVGTRFEPGTNGSVKVRSGSNEAFIADLTAYGILLRNPAASAMPSALQEWRIEPIAGETPYKFQMRYAGNQLRWARAATGRSLVLGPGAGNTPTTVIAGMRFAKTAAEVGKIAAGEVALYERCDKSGRVWIFNETNLMMPDLEYIIGAAPQLVVAGCDTAADVYGGKNRTGNVSRVSKTEACLSGGVRSLTVKRTRKLVVETNACTDCNLRRVDLSNLDLSQSDSPRRDPLRLTRSDLTGARLDGAKLRKAVFEDVELTDADLSRAVLDDATIRGVPSNSRSRAPAARASFRGASLLNAKLESVDFAGADFTDAKLVSSTLKSVALTGAELSRTDLTLANFYAVDFSRTNLAAAKLDAQPRFNLVDGERLLGDPCVEPLTPLTLSKFAFADVKLAQVPVSIWRLVDLTDAKIDFGGASLENQQLCGLRLGGVSFARIKMGSARLDRSDLSRASFSYADLPFASLRNTVLGGTEFTYADLTQTDLQDAVGDANPTVRTSFYGSVFYPKNVAGARLSRSQFTGASVRIPNGAAHVNAQFIDSTFVNADLTGSDLQGLDMRGSIFTNANLTGAHLEGAKLGASAPDKRSVVENAIFCSAFVNGADFSNAEMTGAIFPTTATALPSRDDALATIACNPVDIGGAASIDTAVTTLGARCPSSGAGPCTGALWVWPVTSRPATCPAPPSGGFAPNRKKACAPCTSNCQCSTLYCIAGKCADCPAGG